MTVFIFVHIFLQHSYLLHIIFWKNVFPPQLGCDFTWWRAYVAIIIVSKTCLTSFEIKTWFHRKMFILGWLELRGVYNKVCFTRAGLSFKFIKFSDVLNAKIFSQITAVNTWFQLVSADTPNYSFLFIWYSLIQL